MLEKLQAIKERYIYLEEQMSDPELISDMSRFTKVNKEYKSLTPIVEALEAYQELLSNIRTAREMQREDDPEMREMASLELEELEPQLEEMEEHLKVLLIPKDPEDTKDVIFEIRSGTGGDEASLFAGDLYRMYTRYFEQQGWKVEAVSINEGTVGGYNKLVLEISGDEVYGKLKF